ncbi:putative Kinase-like domain-containing protein [Seiridium unicorne]|uniref:Kinase-like domain-containing protein n=1 Tax=Seiridium unicorne TaxID=138068 RepID=A0ABR2UWE5_9PEZI
MGEEYPSEERTEPFSESEIHLRLQRSVQVDESFESVEDDTVPLDDLIIDDKHHKQGIRILVRPLTRSRSVSPGSDNCEWLALRAEVADAQQPKSRVLAVTQTSKDINFSLRIPGETGVDETRPPIWCELYYDPASDNQILLNRSDVPIALTRLSSSSSPETDDATYGQEVVPGTTMELSPGSWRISLYGTDILDFRILAKRPAVLWLPREESELSSMASSNAVVNSSGKRSFSSDVVEGDDSSTGKRLRTEESLVKENDDNDGVIMFYPRATADPLVFPLPHSSKSKEMALPSGQALLQVQKDETVAIPGGFELDQYQLTKRDQIATTAASSVFTAEHSHVSDGVITVKVLKTRGNNPNAKPQDNHRNVIRQADIWLREYRSQEDLKHESIVRLYGGDARYLSLYMEHIDGKDLAARGVWRHSGSDEFIGDRNDAIRIMKDIAGALNYVHQRRRVHNDIKPANILYSRDRGAVLCDFGLSTRTVDPATNGGTPYYVPPEFIGQKLRGTPSDVWALGVTMLYVLRKITFPDARGRQGHERQLYWMIADINRRSHHHHHTNSKPPSAVLQMQQWLSEVNDAKANLNPRDKLHVLVSQMLTLSPNQRITMAKVMNALQGNLTE